MANFEIAVAVTFFETPRLSLESENEDLAKRMATQETLNFMA
jgi:hypothetical protein